MREKGRNSVLWGEIESRATNERWKEINQ